jgi:fermentation-respiration switch protein FrsA (DUF1100 family)
MNFSVSRISIPLDDFELVGDLYLPETASQDSPAPGIIMSHGFSATRAMGLPAFAEAFATAGYAVALYDHRCLGESGGEPRLAIDPWLQTLDMRRVLDWISLRPEIDPERLGLWGSSFSGGESIVLGAVDQRVKTVIANAPFAGTGGNAESAADEAAFERISAVMRGELEVPERITIGPMPVVREPNNDGPAFLDQPESSDWFLSAGANAGWVNTFTAYFTSDPSFDPMVCAKHISPRALLMNVASEDRVAPTATALEAFDRALEPKTLSMFEGNHFSDYAGDIRDHSIAVMIEFLDEHLR